MRSCQCYSKQVHPQNPKINSLLPCGFLILLRVTRTNCSITQPWCVLKIFKYNPAHKTRCIMNRLTLFCVFIL